MGALSLALLDLEEIRRANKEEQERRKAAVYAKNPDIQEIDRKLRVLGTRLSCAAFSETDAERVFEECKNKITSLRDEKAKLLEKEGFPGNYLAETYTCSACKDTGFNGGEKCGCLKRLISTRLLECANLSGRLREQTFDTFNLSLFSTQADPHFGVSPREAMMSAMNACLTFAENIGKNQKSLFITGGVGIGKTFLSGCIANHALDRGFSVYYDTAFHLFDMAEIAKFNKDGAAEAASRLRFAYSADLLIIDDLGTEFISALSSAAFFDIINSRSLSNKEVVINTNLDMASLERIYSARVTSRILGEYMILPLFGDDLRGKPC